MTFELNQEIIFDDREGIIRYIGPIDGVDEKRIFVGLELKTKTGKNDGSAKGKRYFTCKEGYGLFVPMDKITGSLSNSTRSSSVARMDQDQEQQMTFAELQRIFEEVTMQKELALMDVEKFKEEARELNLKIKTLEEEVKEAKAAVPIEPETFENGEVDDLDTVGQLKSLKNKNEKLRKALMEVNDLVRTMDVERLELANENDALLAENDELREVVDLLKEERTEWEEKIQNLQEQVDVSLQANYLIEELTQKNLLMEEQIKSSHSLQEDYDSLSQMFNHLEKLFEDTDKTHQEEVERLNFTIFELQSERQASEKLLMNAENAILKYRASHADLKAKVQDKEDLILQLQEQLAAESEGEKGVTSLDLLNQKRAFTDTVKYEFAQLESNFAEENIKQLSAFLPENFSKSGGDKDLLLVNLSFPRIVAKSKLLINLVNKKYPDIPGGIRREHVTQSHRGEQWTFVDKFMFSVQGLIAVVQKLESISKHSTIERMSKLALVQPEIAKHEKMIDRFFNLLKENKLDENTSVDDIDRCTTYFNKAWSIHLSTDFYDSNTFMFNTLAQFQTGFRWLKKEIHRIELSLIPLEAETENKITQELEKLTGMIDEADCLVIRGNNSISKEKELKIDNDLMDGIYMITKEIEKGGQFLNESACAIFTQINAVSESDGLKSNEIMEILHLASQRIYRPNKSDSDAFSFIFDSMSEMCKFLTEFNKNLESGLIERPIEERGIVSPIVLRAQVRKEDAAEAESLRWEIQKKDKEIVALNKTIYARLDDLGAMKVKYEMAQKKVDENLNEKLVNDLKGKLENLTKEHGKLKEEYDELVKEKEEQLAEFKKKEETLKFNGPGFAMQKLMDSVTAARSTLHSNEQYDERLQDLNKRYLVLLNEYQKLKCRQTKKELLDLPELKVPDVTAGVYSMKTKSKTDEMLALARKFQREYPKLLIEPLHNETAHKENVAVFNRNVEQLYCQVQKHYARCFN